MRTRLLAISARCSLLLEVDVERRLEGDKLFATNVIVCRRCERAPTQDGDTTIRSALELRDHLVDHVIHFDKVPDPDKVVRLAANYLKPPTIEVKPAVG